MNKKIKIIYASLTGNTEEIASIIFEYYKRLQLDVELIECTQTTPDIFLDATICIVASYTYGREGELPDEIYAFYEELKHLDLTGKIYGTLGSGEEDYGYYCKAADDFDHQFRKTGAKKGAPIVRIELNPDEKDKKEIIEFAQQLLDATTI